MADSERRIIVAVASALNRNAPPALKTVDELKAWAIRRYDQGLLYLDENGRSVPLSPGQIDRAATYAARMRGG